MIRITKLLVLACALAAGGTAAAQPGPPPPPEPAEPPEPPVPSEPAEPPYTEPPPESMPPPPPVAAAPREPKIRINAGLLAAYPTGDNNEDGFPGLTGFPATLSPGFRAAVGYAFSPEMTGHILARHTFVQIDDLPDGFSVSTTDLGIGGRYTAAGPGVNFFGEASLLLSQVNLSLEGFGSISQDGLGVELRGGGAFKIGQRTWIEVSASYLKAFISGQNPDTGEEIESDFDWLSGHVDVAFHL